MYLRYNFTGLPKSASRFLGALRGYAAHYFHNKPLTNIKLSCIINIKRGKAVRVMPSVYFNKITPNGQITRALFFYGQNQHYKCD